MQSYNKNTYNAFTCYLLVFSLIEKYYEVQEKYVYIKYFTFDHLIIVYYTFFCITAPTKIKSLPLLVKY